MRVCRPLTCLPACVEQVFNKSTGHFVRQFGTPGSSNGQFQSPYGIAIHGANHTRTPSQPGSSVRKRRGD